ncbi:MAG: hypothetical protein RIC95_05280 [Vicingaceae bacterium]
MKSIKVICFLIGILLTWSIQAQEGEQWNQTNKQGLKVGKWRATHPNGKVRYTGQFKNGKPFDVFKYYFNNGDLKTVMTYDGEEGQRAYATHYYQTGEKMAEGWYFDQKKDSLWKTYGANEVLLSEGAYYDGKKYGLWRTYYNNGNLAEELYYKDDYEHGPLKTYYDNGQLKQEASFENGFFNGLSVTYDPQGKKVLKGIYYKGARDKNWVYYTDEQEVDKVLEYDKGELLNPEVIKGINQDSLINSVKNNKKDYLEFEDLRGKIKYE